VPINDNVIMREIHSSLLTKILVDKIKNRSTIKYKIFDYIDNDYYEEKVTTTTTNNNTFSDDNISNNTIGLL